MVLVCQSQCLYFKNGFSRTFRVKRLKRKIKFMLMKKYVHSFIVCSSNLQFPWLCSDLLPHLKVIR